MKKQVNSGFKNVTIATLVAAVIFAAVFCSVALLPTSVCEANSAVRYYEGRDSSGVIFTTKDSPVVVEKEDLTFDIQFDDHYLNGLQIGSVSAKYTFKNTGDTEAKTNVVFPIDFLRDINNQNNDDFSKYGVKVNDETINSNLRYSYKVQDSTFSAEDDLKYLKDEIITDDFYTPETVVYKYVYACTAGDSFCKMYFGGIDTRKVVCDAPYTSYWQTLDGAESIGFWANKNEYIFYSIGEEIDFAARAEFYSDYERTNGVNGSFKLLSKQNITFADLAYQYYDESYGVSKTDWYNAVYASLKEVYPKIAQGYCLNVYKNLYCWFEYEMTFAPLETLVNEVVAPLYPDINQRYSPSVYVFNYLVSPAATWKSFADLNVTINTNYYLIGATEDFEQIEGGYAWHSDTLPSSELQFSLSKSQYPKSSGSKAGKIIANIILLSVLEPICIIIVGLVIVIVVIKKKEKSVRYGESRSKSKHRKHDNEARSKDDARHGDIFGEENRNENEPKNIDLPNDKEENGENDDALK